ncbi:MAG: ATP phosphoribosyltransferase regulatory subunit [Alphaproteobacteria bacterium]
MDDLASKSLLPNGLRDGLPPDAAHEADIHNLVLATFAARGYERVEPPLVEFEESLLNGAGEALALSTFRLMDPVSQRMMGVRADMTPQIARIATTRLRKAPRPLRLSYGGPVLRVRGNPLQPDREFRQAGVELIGAEASAADCEVILLAFEALKASGVRQLSVDLTLPTLVPGVCAEMSLDAAKARKIRVALDRKDAAALAAIGGNAAGMLGRLLDAAGPVEKAMPVLASATLPPGPAAERARLIAVTEVLQREAPGLVITVDPVENRGFEYHSGLSFTFFARGVRGELGCGGRYLAGHAGEPSTGFSLFLHNLLRAVEFPPPAKRLLLPPGTGEAAGAALRAQGWVTVAALAENAEMPAEARRLLCSHFLVGGSPVAVASEGEN